MSAQYSVPWCVAVGLRDDPMDPSAYGARGLADERLRALCAAVRCEALPGDRGAWASEVVVTLKDGTSLTGAADDFPGTPTSPLDGPALRDKFLRCAGDFARARTLLDQLERLESVADERALELG
jgi:2-methylcitrate dehydratase PrpD